MTRHDESRPVESALRVGPDENGFISPDQVHLVVSFTGEGAHISGPGVYDMGWVVHALNGLAEQWVHQTPMWDVEPPTPGTEPDGKWMDCTKTDVTVVFHRDCQVISMPGEVFGDGLAAYTLDIVGQRRHEDEYCTARLRALSEAVAEDIAEGRMGGPQ